MARQIILMDKDRIERTLKRIAIQVWEHVEAQEMIIVGLNERGYATARLLNSYLEQLVSDKQITLCKYDVKDLARNKALPNCTEKQVLIVDDVIFSGKTMFDALTAVCSTGDPEQIKVVALVDRGHRRYPIQADLTGMTVPSKLGEHVEVMLRNDKPEQVILFKN